MTSLNPFTLRKNNKLMATQITNLQKALLIQETNLHKAALDITALRKKNKELSGLLSKTDKDRHGDHGAPAKTASVKAAKKSPAK